MNIFYLVALIALAVFGWYAYQVGSRKKAGFLSRSPVLITVPYLPSSENWTSSFRPESMLQASDQIIADKVSDHTLGRRRELWDKNREEALTEAENAELDAFEYVDYFMSLLKAKASCTIKD